MGQGAQSSSTRKRNLTSQCGLQKRNMKVWPPWMATEEGMTISDWLLYRADACGVYTAARSRWPAIYDAMNTMRTIYMYKDVREEGLHPEIQENSTLFFELLCDPDSEGSH